RLVDKVMLTVCSQADRATLARDFPRAVACSYEPGLVPVLAGVVMLDVRLVGLGRIDLGSRLWRGLGLAGLQLGLLARGVLARGLAAGAGDRGGEGLPTAEGGGHWIARADILHVSVGSGLSRPTRSLC